MTHYNVSRSSLGRMFFTCFEEVGDQICDQSLRRQCPRLPHLWQPQGHTTVDPRPRLGGRYSSGFWHPRFERCGAPTGPKTPRVTFGRVDPSYAPARVNS
jgi:hypothetical protein